MILVYVEWVDSARLSDHWHDVSKVEAEQPLVCRSVGWVTSTDPVGDPQHHVLHPHVQMGTDGEPMFTYGGLVIPRPAVLRMNVVTRKWLDVPVDLSFIDECLR